MCSDPKFTGDILVTSNSELEHEKLLLIGRSIIPIVNGRGQVWIINANEYDIRLPPNNKIESLEAYESDSKSYIEMNYLQDLQEQLENPVNETLAQLNSIEECDRAEKLFKDCKFGEKLTTEQKDQIKFSCRIPRCLFILY